MSRSYRKYPLIKSRDSGKFTKRLANRKIRHNKDFSVNNTSYKRLYESMDIKNHCSIETEDDVIINWYEDQSAITDEFYCYSYKPTLQEALNDWKISYKCK